MKALLPVITAMVAGAPGTGAGAAPASGGLGGAPISMIDTNKDGNPRDVMMGFLRR